MNPSLLMVVLVGAGIGFLGGLLGKGGSAIATPVLVAFGVPPNTPGRLASMAVPIPLITMPITPTYKRKWTAFATKSRKAFPVVAGAGCGRV